jgi:hypothetical protein
MEDNKKIIISGQPNRYQIKKLTTDPIINKKRIEIEKLNLPSEYFTFEKQFELINNYLICINNNCNDNETTTDNNFKTMIKQLGKKILGYKQQDINKKLLDSSKFVTLQRIIEKLVQTEMKCYYCNLKMSLLYENVREQKQWTIDRINNDLGHNHDNFVLACLKCNLKRRRQNCDDFLFTKQLNIIKQDT